MKFQMKNNFHENFISASPKVQVQTPLWARSTRVVFKKNENIEVHLASTLLDHPLTENCFSS